ncbi:hypothetical protein [Trichothermofontia sp.]
MNKGAKQFAREIQRLEQQQAADTSALLTIDAGANQWQPVIFREAGIALRMPAGAVTQETKTITTPDQSLRFTILATNPSGTRFMVAYSDELGADLFNDAAGIFTLVQNRIVAQVGAAAGAVQRLEVGGTQSRNLRDAAATIQFRLILHQNRLLVLGVSQPNATHSTQTVTAFFNSLTFL